MAFARDLTPEQWREAKALTDALLDLPREERERHLQRYCADPVIRAEARSLLAEYERDEFVDFPQTERFVARRRLGCGGFGTVYEAYDSEQEIVLALKVLTQKDPPSLDRFKREFWILREMDHPNLIKLYQLFQSEECWFFTMQLVKGTSFLEHVNRENRSGDRQCLRSSLLQLCRGVHALHKFGKIHRDLKPDNILVNHVGTVVLIDLGMARELRTVPVQQSVTIVGSPHYLSPEQGRGGLLTEATDWYSVGVILYEALTGEYPFTGKMSDEIIARKCAKAAPEPIAVSSYVPEDLNALCRDLLQLEPQMRPRGSEILCRLGDAQNESKRSVPIKSTFVGRKGILRSLDELFTATQRSNACILTNIRGRSGIGKSTLIRVFQQQLISEFPNAVILAGRCHESARIRFKVLDIVIDSLSTYLKTLLPLEVKALLPRDVPSLVRLFPSLKQVDTIARVRIGGPSTLDSQELRERAFEALVELLGRLGEMKPLILSIDDLQWGDKDSAAFFRHILAHSSPPRALILMSYRSEDSKSSVFLQPYYQLLQERSRLGTVEVVDVEVQELSSEESCALARELLPNPLKENDETVAAIVEESAQTPFLIVEFARYAAACSEQGRTPQYTLDEVTRQRIDDLPAAAKKLLNVIAVAGQPVPEAAAFKSARLDSDDFPGLQSLAAESHIRIRETPNGRELETYHDRYRESVLKTIDPKERKELHLGLATALMEQASPDPAFIAAHFRLAGQNESAAQYFLSAAEKASAAYAFDLTSDFYRLAVELGSFRLDERLRLAQLHGDALVQAGRGREAAEVFSKAALESPTLQQLDFQRKAAEQLLRNGDLNEGLKLVRAVASTLGIWIGERPWQTILSLAWRRIIISLIGPRFRVRSPAEISPRHLAILDTYWSLAVGLSLVDMIRAHDFSARHFLLAIRVGEPQRIALSLALEAGHSMIQRNRSRERANRSLKCAKDLAKQCGQKQVIGIVEGMETVCGFLVGEWRHAYECGVRSEKLLREQCTGVRWEIVSICIFSLKCLNMMGNWKMYAERLAPLLKEARNKGDRYAATGLLLLTHSYVLDLVDDQPDAALRRIGEAVSEWSQEGFHLQNFWAFYGETETELYEGLSIQAMERVARTWSCLQHSLLLRGQVVNILALHLRARSLTAAAWDIRPNNPDKAAHLVQQAEMIVEQIKRQDISWGRSLAHLLDSSICLYRGANQRAAKALLVGEHGCSLAQMAHYRAASQCCRGHLVGGQEGETLIKTGEHWLISQGVKNTRRILRLLIPGDWEASYDNAG